MLCLTIQVILGSFQGGYVRSSELTESTLQQNSYKHQKRRWTKPLRGSWNRSFRPAAAGPHGRTAQSLNQSFLPEPLCEKMETLLAAHSNSQRSFP